MTRPLDTPVHLKVGELLPIEDGAGFEVSCLQGELWITQEGDREDRVVSSGKSFVLDRSGLAVVTAVLEPALLIVQPGRVQARHPLRHAA